MSNASLPKLIMLGMQNEFSRHTLINLIALGSVPSAVVVLEEKQGRAPHAHAIPVAVADSLSGATLAADITLITIPSLDDPRSFERIEKLNPDVVLVACFAQRLTPKWLSVPLQLGVNLHPSLLPRFRGPCPLFWQFRSGELVTGITLHLLSEEFDSGDVVSQSPLVLQPGDDFASVTVNQAELGATLVSRLLQRLSAGHRIETTKQSDADATYQPMPAEQDFVLDSSMSVEQAYRFIRGVQSWGHPFTFSGSGGELLLHRALDYKPEATLDAPYKNSENGIRIQLRDGVLTAEGSVVN
jgi:methionyl-tRNA formyltransferase